MTTRRRTPARFIGSLTAGVVVLVVSVACTAPGGSERATSPSGPPGDTTTSAESVPSTFEEIERCMREQGWDAEANGQGVQLSAPSDQFEASQAAMRACWEAAGVDTSSPPRYTAEQAGTAYDALLPLVACLREAGLPAADPPSREAYVADLTEGRIPPHPYDQAAEDGRLAEAEAACPAPEGL